VLDLDEFTEQFRTIEVYGADVCQLSYNQVPLMYCVSSNMQDNIFDTDCNIKTATAAEKKYFGFNTKAEIKLSRNANL
jgi:hypothetical protein